LSEKELSEIKVGESYSPSNGVAEIFMWKRREDNYRLLHRYENFKDDGNPNLKFPRVSLAVHGGRLFFMGAYLPVELRGQGIFEEYLALLDSVSEKVNMVFDSTVIIRKPIMARKLMDNGFLPVKSGAQLIEILPILNGDKKKVRVGVSEEQKRHLEGNEKLSGFFELFGGDQLGNFPITDPDRSLVFIKTQFYKGENYKVINEIEFDLKGLDF